MRAYLNEIKTVANINHDGSAMEFENTITERDKSRKSFKFHGKVCKIDFLKIPCPSIINM